MALYLPELALHELLQVLAGGSHECVLGQLELGALDRLLSTTPPGTGACAGVWRHGGTARHRGRCLRFPASGGLAAGPASRSVALPALKGAGGGGGQLASGTCEREGVLA